MRSHRSLWTILFTDIVGSTKRAAELGDRAWRELLERHHALVRQTLRQWGAREVNEAGDGFFAILDSPARGIACAAAIREVVQSLRLEVRSGVHMGEVEDAANGSVGGIGVHIGARVAASAEPGEILVSRAVRDAVEGSGFAFEDRGAFALKGIPEERRLYRVTALPEHVSSLAPGRGERIVPALRARPGWVGAAAVVLVALAAVFTLRYGETPGRGAEDPAPAAVADAIPAIDRSIAVLPFDNLSADPADAFFAEGITDDVLAALSKLDDLRVISRTSVLQYRETTKPIGQIAQELRVGTVLEGTVRRAGDRVRITVQLIDARTDEHLWAEQYDRELTDVFAIQTEIAEAIAGRLNAELAAKERRRIDAGQTDDPEAYLLVLKARDRTRIATSGAAQIDTIEEELRGAIDLLRQALERDPRYARAYAELAGVYSRLAVRKGGSWADSSRVAALRAIELDPRLAAAHRALGDAHSAAGRGSDAIESYRRAIELDPNNVEAIAGLGSQLVGKGRFDEGLRLRLKAVSLEPTNVDRYGAVGRIYGVLEMLDEAAAWYAREVELAPDKALGHAHLATNRFVRGDTLGARAEIDKAQDLGPGEFAAMDAIGFLELNMGNWEGVRRAAARLHAVSAIQGHRLAVYIGYAYERLGDEARAAELYRAAERDARRQMNEREDFSPAYTLAILDATRGDEEAALYWLDEAYRRGFRERLRLLLDPLFDNLRDDPRFQQLQARMDADLARMRERVRREGLVRRP